MENLKKKKLSGNVVETAARINKITVVMIL